MLVRALGIAQAVFERVLGGEERHNSLTRDVAARVGREVPQVVLFMRAHCAIGQEDEGAFSGQSPDRMIGVDPGVHALAGRQLRAWGPELGGQNRRTGAEGRDEVGGIQGGYCAA